MNYLYTKGGIFMKTELQFSVIYLAQDENDVNQFDFFIRTIPAEDKNVISVVAVPRYSLDGKVIKHINFKIMTKELYAYDVLAVIAKLKLLEEILSNPCITTQEAETLLKEQMLIALEQIKKD